MRVRFTTALIMLTFIGLPKVYADEVSGFTAYVQAQAAIRDFKQLPQGLESKQLHTPLLVGLEVNAGQGRTTFFGDLHAAYLGYTISPAFGISMGPVIPVGIGKLKIAAELESNGTLGSGMEDSYLKAWRWGASGELSVEQGIFRPSFRLRWINMTTVQIANFENLPTKIAHQPTFVFKPGLLVKFPVVQAEATVGIYSLGKTAITSKDFTFPIDRQTIFRPTLGAGFDLPGLELWLRTSAIYALRYGDSTEYLYMAPVYVNENLMTQKALAVELRFQL